MTIDDSFECREAYREFYAACDAHRRHNIVHGVVDYKSLRKQVMDRAFMYTSFETYDILKKDGLVRIKPDSRATGVSLALVLTEKGFDMLQMNTV